MCHKVTIVFDTLADGSFVGYVDAQRGPRLALRGGWLQPAGHGRIRSGRLIADYYFARVPLPIPVLGIDVAPTPEGLRDPVRVRFLADDVLFGSPSAVSVRRVAPVDRVPARFAPLKHTVKLVAARYELGGEVYLLAEKKLVILYGTVVTPFMNSNLLGRETAAGLVVADEPSLQGYEVDLGGSVVTLNVAAGLHVVPRALPVAVSAPEYHESAGMTVPALFAPRDVLFVSPDSTSVRRYLVPNPELALALGIVPERLAEEYGALYALLRKDMIEV